MANPKQPNFVELVLRLLQWVIGVRISMKNLNTRNFFDAVMIVLATYFLFPIYSSYLDIFAQAVDGNFFNRFAIEGFRFSFIVSSAWLILISLFSEARLSILKFFALMIPGMLLGIALTYLLGNFVDFLKAIWKIDEITLFVMTVYPILFSYFVRSKIMQFTKHRPQVPKLTEFQRSVYIE